MDPITATTPPKEDPGFIMAIINALRSPSHKPTPPMTGTGIVRKAADAGANRVKTIDEQIAAQGG